MKAPTTPGAATSSRKTRQQQVREVEKITAVEGNDESSVYYSKDPSAGEGLNDSAFANQEGAGGDEGSLVQIHDQGPPDASKFDLCITFKSHDTNDLSDGMYMLLEQLIHQFGRKNLYLYESPIQNLTFILIRGSVGKLKLRAEKDKFPMLLDPTMAERTALKGDSDYNILPLVLQFNFKESNILPYEYIYSGYRTDLDLQQLYWKPQTANHPFRRSVRLKLIQRILREPDKNGRPILDLDKLLMDGVISGYYPLHDWAEISTFRALWLGACSMPFLQPIQAVREYFGEKIAFYFAFTEFLSFYLIPVCLMGLAFNIAGFAMKNPTRPEIPVFSFVMMIWAIVVMCSWKQRACILNLYWGNLEKENDIGSPDAHARSWFKGVIRPASKDGKQSLEYKKRTSALPGCITMMTLFGCGIATAVALYVLKVQLKVSSVDPSLPWIVSAITGVWAFIMNYVYHYIACAITHLENYRTDTEFKKVLASRIFWLQFINNFATFYYIAFAGPYIGMPDKTDWMSTCGSNGHLRCPAELLMINIICVYGIQIFFKNFFFYFVPYMLNEVSNFCILISRPDFKFSQLPCVRCTCLHSQSFKNLISHAAEFFGCVGDGDRISGRESIRGDDSIEMWDIYSDRSSKSNYKLNPNGSSRIQITGSGRDHAMLTAGGVTLDDAASLPEMDFFLASWDQDISISSGGKGFRKSIFSISNADQSSLYAEVALCLGYLLYFSSFFPIVTVMCFIDLLLMYRRHAWRLLHLYRRPFPESQITLANVFFAQSEIQIWKTLFDLCVSLAVVTNAGLIFFVMTPFKDITVLSEKVWCFFAFIAFCMVFRAIIAKQIAEVPKKAKLQLLRNETIVNKLINRIPDDHQDPSNIL